MPEKRNTEILSKYELYLKVRKSIKNILNQRIELKEDKRHSGVKKKTENMHHPDLSHLEFLIRVSRPDYSKYNFGLRSIDLCLKPFFRFDSAGPSHRNRSPKTSLALQSISTPHFQYYNDEGINIAYKTDSLKKIETLKEIVDDINIGIEYFCQESLSFFNKTKYPTIIVESTGTIPFPKTITDPLAGISFE